MRFFTGMRTGEAHGLKWKYVDFDKRLILVRETFVLGEDEYTKTDSSQRDIQMSQLVYEALKRPARGHRQAQRLRLLQPAKASRSTTRTSATGSGTRCCGTWASRRRRPYQMRHTAATLWLASGEAPEWIANSSDIQQQPRCYSRSIAALCPT